MSQIGEVNIQDLIKIWTSKPKAPFSELSSFKGICIKQICKIRANTIKENGHAESST